MSTAVHRSPKNFGDPTPYLTYDDPLQQRRQHYKAVWVCVYATKSAPTSVESQVQSLADFFIIKKLSGFLIE
jgi:hypothetical protein